MHKSHNDFNGKIGNSYQSSSTSNLTFDDSQSTLINNSQKTLRQLLIDNSQSKTLNQ